MRRVKVAPYRAPKSQPAAGHSPVAARLFMGLCLMAVAAALFVAAVDLKALPKELQDNQTFQSLYRHRDAALKEAAAMLGKKDETKPAPIVSGGHGYKPKDRAGLDRLVTEGDE